LILHLIHYSTLEASPLVAAVLQEVLRRGGGPPQPDGSVDALSGPRYVIPANVDGAPGLLVADTGGGRSLACDAMGAIRHEWRKDTSGAAIERPVGLAAMPDGRVIAVDAGSAKRVCMVATGRE